MKYFVDCIMAMQAAINPSAVRRPLKRTIENNLWQKKRDA
jgi:hypothetical protein